MSTPRKRLPPAERREVIERAATAVFAQKGYYGASIDEIARRSGVTPPVVYDHFASKQQLYESLIERHYSELRAIWFEWTSNVEPVAVWLPLAFDAWFAYIETHRFAGRMLFHDTTGDARIAAMHRRVQNRSRAALLPLLAQQTGNEDLELAWETLRAVLQGLAAWWYEHKSVPRERIVAAAMNAIWIGFERVLDGERWQP